LTEGVAQLAQEFGWLLRQQRSPEFPVWIDRAAHSPLAAGLRRDFAAVQSAFASPWSQGQVEGQVNRLKMLKRHMYGRAAFPRPHRVTPRISLETSKTLNHGCWEKRFRNKRPDSSRNAASH
jgi:hypothetical protein